MQDEQISIYDFLNGESQEVAPSETLPQVDEAQTVELYADGVLICKETISSSALGTITFEHSGKTYVTSKPTEDTDNVVTNSTLFSVGDTVKVRQANDVYDKYSSTEDYYFMKEYEGMSVTLESFDGQSWECYFPEIGRHKRVYPNELIKI